MLFAQSARIFEEKLTEPDQAVDQLRKLLEETPRRRRGAGRPGSHLHRTRSATPIWSRCSTSGRDSRSGRRTRDELAFRAARITETELSDVEGAISRYQGILAATPDHAGDAGGAVDDRARRRLPRARDRGAGADPARGARLGPRSSSCSSCAWRSRTRSSAGWRCWARSRASRRLERRDVDSAFATWARALTEEATEAAPRQALERLAAATGDWKRLAEVYEERMEATFDAALQRSLALRLAALYEKELARPGARRGVPAQGAVAAGRRGAGAGVAGDRSCGGRARTPSWPRSWRARRRSRAIRSEQADFLAALGEVRLTALDDADGALTALPRRHRPQPGAHAGARAALLDAARSRRRRARARSTCWSRSPRRAATINELIALYERRLELHDDRAERAHWLRKIAEVAADQLGELRSRRWRRSGAR